VDSSVAAALIFRAVGHQFEAVFVDNGCSAPGRQERIRAASSTALMGNDPASCLPTPAERFPQKLKTRIRAELKRKNPTYRQDFYPACSTGKPRNQKRTFLAQGTLYFLT